LHIALSLRLPHDRLSVPLTRRMARQAMDEMGVVTEDRGDVELALTEAAANVLQHAGPGEAYDVRFELTAEGCEIQVIDVGVGFDGSLVDPSMAEPGAERGRGIALMHALVDQMRFASHPERGTIVHLVKHLRFDDEVPARQMMLAALARQDRRED
jgi:serine/threonine-protein kinase RsbW